MNIFNKKLFFLILLIPFIFCSSFQKKESREMIDKIFFYSLKGGEIRTPSNVFCQDFENTFKGSIDSLDCTKLKERILTFLKSIKVSKDYQPVIDTRSKMYIYYKSKKIDTLCFGYTDIFSLNGVDMESTNYESFKIIDSLLTLW